MVSHIPLVVHPLNESDIWQDCDPGAARSAMTPAPAPEEGVLVRLSILGGAFDRLFDLRPSIEPAPLQRQRAQDLPPRLDQVQIGCVFRLEDKFPARMGQIEQEHIESTVGIEVVHHGIDPLGGGVNPTLDPAQKVDPMVVVRPS